MTSMQTIVNELVAASVAVTYAPTPDNTLRHRIATNAAVARLDAMLAVTEAAQEWEEDYLLVVTDTATDALIGAVRALRDQEAEA